MKFGICVLTVIFSAITLAATPLTIALSNTNIGPDKSGKAAFAIEVALAYLGNNQEIDLVDRKSLDTALQEQGLAAQGVTQNGEATKIGKVLGAKYIGHFRTLETGDRQLLTCRIIQVSTTLYKNIILPLPAKDDPTKLGEQLSEQIIAEIASLEDKKLPNSETQPLSDIPADLKRPVVAIRLLETAIGTQPADPASEIQLTRALLSNKFTVRQLSRPSKSVAAGQMAPLEGAAHESWLKEARKAKVDVLVIGEAFSEDAGRLGKLEASRARVELHAFRVTDGMVLCADSGYGTALDAARLVAGKKAIENATTSVASRFLRDLVDAWQP